MSRMAQLEGPTDSGDARYEICADDLGRKKEAREGHGSAATADRGEKRESVVLHEPRDEIPDWIRARASLRVRVATKRLEEPRAVTRRRQAAPLAALRTRALPQIFERIALESLEPPARRWAIHRPASRRLIADALEGMRGTIILDCECISGRIV